MSKFSKIMSKFSKFLLAPVTCSNFAPRHSNRFGPPAECSKSDFGHFWAILALFGRSWAKIWGTPPPLQTGSKTSTWTSCNRFGPPECSSLRGEANKHYWPQKGANFWLSGPENGPPSSRTGTYRKPKGIQSYLRTWGIYDSIESGLSEVKKVR